MCDSEIDYPKILIAIKNSGYQGSVGQEYIPVHEVKEGLAQLWGQLDSI